MLLLAPQTMFMNTTTFGGNRRLAWAGRFTQRRSLAKAFTLVEVAVGGTVLVLAIIGTLTMASQSYLLTQHIREFSRANQVLQQKMEDVRLLTFSEVQALPATFKDPSDTKNFYAGTITKETYRTDATGAVVSLKVTLKVTWKGRASQSRSQTLVSVFTRNGLNDYVF
jgi:Tfp pilus assembly protein PilV